MMSVVFDELYKTPAIIDNSVLNELTKIGAVSMLNIVFSNVYMAENMIRDEARFPGAYEALAELEPVRAVVETKEGMGLLKEILKKRKMLSRYDAEVIAIAAEKNLVCCSSDRSLIKTCDNYGIRRIGTLGVLTLMYRHDHLAQDEFRSKAKI